MSKHGNLDPKKDCTMLPFNWDEKLLMGYDKQTRNDIAESAKAFDDFCARFQTYFSLMDEPERWGRNELRWAYRKVFYVSFDQPVVTNLTNRWSKIV